MKIRILLFVTVMLLYWIGVWLSGIEIGRNAWMALNWGISLACAIFVALIPFPEIPKIKDSNPLFTYRICPKCGAYVPPGEKTCLHCMTIIGDKDA